VYFLQELQQALRDRAALREQLSGATSTAEARAAELALTIRQLQCAHDDHAALKERQVAERQELSSALAQLRDSHALECGMQVQLQQLERELQRVNAQLLAAQARGRRSSDCGTLSSRSVPAEASRTFERIAMLQAELEQALLARQQADSLAAEVAACLEQEQQSNAAGTAEAQERIAGLQQQLQDSVINAERQAAEAASAVQISHRQVEVLQQEMSWLRSARRSDSGLAKRVRRNSADGHCLAVAVPPRQSRVLHACSMEQAHALQLQAEQAVALAKETQSALSDSQRACAVAEERAQRLQAEQTKCSQALALAQSQAEEATAAQVDGERRLAQAEAQRHAAQAQLLRLQRQIEADAGIACQHMEHVLAQAHSEVNDARRETAKMKAARAQAEETARSLAADLTNLRQALGRSSVYGGCINRSDLAHAGPSDATCNI
jgi:hypothetical protein